jgi:hypothetical protein
MIYSLKFLQALIFTEIVEISALLVLVRWVLTVKPKKLSSSKIIFVGFLASLATIPYLWYVLPWFLNLRHYIFLAELGIVMFEAFIYYQLLNIKIKDSFWISLICNSLSYFLGKLFILIIK